MGNNLTFSLKPIAAIVLWSMPLFISILIVFKWSFLRGISGVIVQLLLTYLSLVITIQFVLGLFGLLSFYYVFAFFLFLLIICIILASFKNLRTILTFEKYLLPSNLKFQEILADFQGYYWFFSVLLIYLFVMVIQGIISPPVHIDCLKFYLPQTVGWLQTHSIFEHSSPLSYYHHSSLLLTLWMILPFGSDLFINIQNLIPALLLLASFCQLLKLLGIDRKLSFLAGVTFISLPKVSQWLWNQKTEIMLTAFFMTALCFYIDYFERKRSSSLVMGFFCTGLVVGTKSFGIYYGILLYFIFTIFYLFNSKGREWKLFIIASFICLVVALQWPIRNWIIWGNPFYPMQVTILGIHLFNGPGLWGESKWIIFLVQQ